MHNTKEKGGFCVLHHPKVLSKFSYFCHCSKQALNYLIFLKVNKLLEFLVNHAATIYITRATAITTKGNK